ncbi:MAG TPA: bacillithiol system redox-active protein YtxJ [Acidobacteria bacterium]|jgi:bacillithiol system protein YtxJ|nr:bacillithiol system redox-active protein YtxJ [Acidobacteriota bacterium]MDP6373408.1 bacillithiol system redox-active protein YtxJ [Vicinamibacterales bacterium]HAK55656.1 bacillithiol system redox-active protein YtxJ [Acidobacteriota bacterium]|tara:strand:- start:4769 stop:5149 length:381 start_codon:yes stop_codon:yes gene_type:complete
MATQLIPLESIADLDAALTESSVHPLLLFKHSADCGASFMALDELQRHLEDAPEVVRYRLITIQTERDVSDEAAARLGVPHRSPQAILVLGGEAVWNASHLQITAETLQRVTAPHVAPANPNSALA